MAFIARGTLNPHGAPVIRRNILANSITVTELDSVKYASGFVALGTAGVLVAGHVVAITADKGVGLESTGVAGAESGSFVGTFLTASDNQTVGKVKGDIDVSKASLYSAEVDATIGTTTGSDLLGFKMDLIDEDTLDESSAVTGTAQYSNWGVDALDTTKAFVNIYESVVSGV